MTIVKFKKTDAATEAVSEVAAASSPQRKIIIAVDGPAASGKGTLARKIAERLGYAYLDTGALYRAVALATLEMNGDPSNVEAVMPAVEMIKRNLTMELLASPTLRKPEVSEASSKVAALPQVRTALLEFQRDFAHNPPGNVGGAVLDGRDIGTVVCPDADIKFFVTAKPEARAQRRFNELQWHHPLLTLEKVLADLLQRDQRDTSREVAPTHPSDDAYLLDTTKLNPAEVLETAIHIVQERFLVTTDA
jgi:cytidylate kinase